MPARKSLLLGFTTAVMSAIFLGVFTGKAWAQVKINEFMVNDANEWIELFSTDITLSSADYWIDDDDSLIVNGSVQTGGDDPGSNPIQLSVDFQGTNFFIIELSSYLNNSGDHPTLFLYENSVEQIIDSYEYSSDPGSSVTLGRWPDGGSWIPILPSATKNAPNSEPPAPSPSPEPSPSPTPEPDPTPSPESEPNPTPSPVVSPSPKTTTTTVAGGTTGGGLFDTHDSEEMLLSTEDGEILGMAEPEASEATESKKEKNPFLISIILVILGLGFVGGTGVVFYKQRGYNETDEENGEN